MTQTPTSKTKAKTITILVNNRPVEVEDRSLTGTEIKAAAQIPDNFKLYNHKGEEIGDQQTVKVHRNERFIAISGQDVS